MSALGPDRIRYRLIKMVLETKLGDELMNIRKKSEKMNIGN